MGIDVIYMKLYDDGMEPASLICFTEEFTTNLETFLRRCKHLSVCLSVSVGLFTVAEGFGGGRLRMGSRNDQFQVHSVKAPIRS